MTTQPRPPQLTIHDLDWMSHGRCRETDPDLWWPQEGDHYAREAKTICRSCPVRVLCLDYAQQHRIGDGIWGGLTVKERHRLRREKRTDAA